MQQLFLQQAATVKVELLLPCQPHFVSLGAGAIRHFLGPVCFSRYILINTKLVPLCKSIFNWSQYVTNQFPSGCDQKKGSHSCKLPLKKKTNKRYVQRLQTQRGQRGCRSSSSSFIRAEWSFHNKRTKKQHRGLFFQWKRCFRIMLLTGFGKSLVKDRGRLESLLQIKPQAIATRLNWQ